MDDGPDSRGRDEGGIAPPRRVALWSAAARAVPHIAAFFPGTEVVGRRGALAADAWAGWGTKPVSRAVGVAAVLLGRRMLRLEDGFLRSAGLGKDGAALMSLVVDDLGIYYDARRPSRLERLVARRRSAGDRARASAFAGRLAAARLSKYNTGAREAGSLPPGRILVIDQVCGDLSIAGALATVETFRAMLAEACRAHGPDAVVLKPHPDVLAGHARGFLFDPRRGAPLPPGITVLTDALDIQAVLDRSAAVWTVSSQVGFEALLRGLPVTTFGLPFYAGWGLTDDRARGAAATAAFARRTARPTSDDLLGAALLDYPRYADPATHRPIAAEDALDLLRRARG